jgi:short-subunit dehydrogenase
MKPSFVDKTAVVTGVTSGIGEAIAEGLIDAGGQVVGIARNPQKLEELTRRWGRRFEALVVDLADTDKRTRVLSELATRQKRVDIVVSNAAECLYEPPLDTSQATYRRLLEVNVLAGIELVQTLVPRMEPGGHIVQLSSVTARHLPAPRFAPYAMTKAIVERFIEALVSSSIRGRSKCRWWCPAWSRRPSTTRWKVFRRPAPSSTNR